jgi:hypothetical protein
MRVRHGTHAAPSDGVRFLFVIPMLASLTARADDCERVDIWQNGKRIETICGSAAVARGMTVIDLGDDWVPPVLDAGPDGDAPSYYRTHGTGNVVSLANGVSHGCHRLLGYDVVRLANFMLAHRTYVRRGDTPTSYRRTVRFGGRFPIAIDSLGYRIAETHFAAQVPGTPALRRRSAYHEDNGSFRGGAKFPPHRRSTATRS